MCQKWKRVFIISDYRAKDVTLIPREGLWTIKLKGFKYYKVEKQFSIILEGRRK